MASKSILKSVKHERLSVAGKYASGGTFHFVVTRAGETCEWAGADGADGRRQLEAFAAFCAFRDGETNAQRIQRIYDVAMQANTCAEFVSLMS